MAQLTAKFFPIKYKFLVVILSLLLMALGIFFTLTYRTFMDDKRLFVLDLNLSVLDSATNAVTLELRGRIEDLGNLMSRYYNGYNSESDFFRGLPSTSTLPEEVLRATVFRQEGGTFSAAKRFQNAKAWKTRELTSELLDRLDSAYPLPLENLAKTGELAVLNRSLEQGSKNHGIVTVLFSAKNANTNGGTSVLMAIDLTSDFLGKALRRSEVAEIFLLDSQGRLIAHPKTEEMVRYAAAAFPHPAAQKLKENKTTKESFEDTVNGEPYFISLGDTPFKDISIVSQVKKSQAMLALRRLTRNSLFLLAAVIYGVVLVSVFAVRTLTSNIQKLKSAAEEVGRGNLEVQVPVKTNDEVQKVADSFQWMIQRVKELLKETAQKARMEEELKTASLVQSTLLTHAEISAEWAAEIEPFYSPASECGGDFWDLQWNGNTVTVVLGDATGHGVSAAIVTAVAKSFFSTLSMLYPNSVMTPEKFLGDLNKIIYQSCKGKLLMTMAFVQLNVETGEVVIVNAGHESPMLLPGQNEEGKKKKAEVLFARGERLGFNPEATYETARFKINVGDTVLLYTDGVSEAVDPEGKEFGERALKKTFAATDGSTLAQTKDLIMKAVNEHRNGAAQADDITFVLLRWQRAMKAAEPAGVTRPLTPIPQAA